MLISRWNQSATDMCGLSFTVKFSKKRMTVKATLLKIAKENSPKSNLFNQNSFLHHFNDVARNLFMIFSHFFNTKLFEATYLKWKIAVAIQLCRQLLKQKDKRSNIDKWFQIYYPAFVRSEIFQMVGIFPTNMVLRMWNSTRKKCI